MPAPATGTIFVCSRGLFTGHGILVPRYRVHMKLMKDTNKQSQAVFGGRPLLTITEDVHFIFIFLL